MWKYVSRGVKESLERGLGLNRGRPQEPHNQQRCSRFTSFCRGSGLAGSRLCATSYQSSTRGSSSQHQPPDDEEPQHRNHQFNNPKQCIFGTISCSSALVLGWVLTQPFLHWRKWLSKDKCHLKSSCPLVKSVLWSSQIKDPLVSCRSRLCDPLSTLLRGFNLSRLLPVSLAAPHNSSPSAVLLASSSDQEDSKQQEIEYGPLTADQALDEAAEEMRQVHERTMSIAENQRGVDAASRHRYAKAVALFRAASAKSYPPAQYNLAQCYELGLGTKQDFTKAAEWYSKAAESDHPGAMYNLAVFYAHGWGGLEPDSAKARQLLKKAADRGQPDALAALGYPGQSPPPSITPVIDKEDLWPSNQDEEAASEESDSYHNFSSNPIALYNLAQSFEKSSGDCSTDAHLIMDLYKFASDLGHSAAKARLQILQTYDAVGLLEEFLFSNKIISNEPCDAEFLINPHRSTL